MDMGVGFGSTNKIHILIVVEPHHRECTMTSNYLRLKWNGAHKEPLFLFVLFGFPADSLSFRIWLFVYFTALYLRVCLVCAVYVRAKHHTAPEKLWSKWKPLRTRTPHVYSIMPFKPKRRKQKLAQNNIIIFIARIRQCLANSSWQQSPLTPHCLKYFFATGSNNKSYKKIHCYIHFIVGHLPSHGPRTNNHFTRFLRHDAINNYGRRYIFVYGNVQYKFCSLCVQTKIIPT